jgi:hypothetical protein
MSMNRIATSRSMPATSVLVILDPRRESVNQHLTNTDVAGIEREVAILFIDIRGAPAAAKALRQAGAIPSGWVNRASSPSPAYPPIQPPWCASSTRAARA